MAWRGVAWRGVMLTSISTSFAQSPDEIAQSVDFLCAEQSGLITGATIPVDGGLHLT